MEKHEDPSEASGVHESAAPQATPTAEEPLDVDRARERLWQTITADERGECIKLVLADYDSLKEKVSKLKALLGRSAKAQREAKVDLEGTQKRLDHALREIDRLQKKIDKLASRPTHMELLADFETNFDRAMLSVQSVGEDTAPPAAPMSTATSSSSASTSQPQSPAQEAAVVDSLLMQELADYKQRMERLESVNRALTYKSSQLEAEAKDRRRERDEIASRLSHVELEKRMAVMEADQATRAMQEKAASLAEMQMEIDMVTKASVSASARAAQGQELLKTALTDKQQIARLTAQVSALQEWAEASAESKRLALERVHALEHQLRAHHEDGKETGTDEDAAGEHHLFTQNGSMVIGAGDEAHRVFSLDDHVAKKLKLSDRVVLKWKFDLTPDDLTIGFSIYKGECDTASKRKTGDTLIKNRLVTGGAGGELERAFESKNSCTLVWSNKTSWVKPRTVRYTVEAVIVSY